MAPKIAVKPVDVVPTWWAFGYIGLLLMAMLPIAYMTFTDPMEDFLGGLPMGYDLATDNLKTSLRVAMKGVLSSHSYLMILSIFIGNIVIAKYWAAGHPQIQQAMVNLVVLTGLASDIWLMSTVLLMYPRELAMTPSKWPSGIQGMFMGVPVVSVWKLLWLFGIGRDTV